MILLIYTIATAIAVAMASLTMYFCVFGCAAYEDNLEKFLSENLKNRKNDDII